MTRDTLLQAILRDPDQDAPRLAFADWIEGQNDPARAAFIRAQCQSEPLSDHDPRREDLQATEEDLEAEHRERWMLELPPWARPSCTFRRGFPDLISCTPAEWLAGSEELRRVAPIRSLELFSVDLDGLREVCRSSSLAGLRGLRLVTRDLGDEGAQVLASCPHLEALREFTLEYARWTKPGAQAFIKSTWLAGLTNLAVTDTRSPELARALAGCSPFERLETLDLSGNELGETGARALAESAAFPRLHSLRLYNNDLRSAGAIALAGAPLLTGLTSLDLDLNSIEPDGARALAASPCLPHLVSLNLYSNYVGAAGLKALLAAIPPGPLRRLDIGSNFTFDSSPARAIKELAAWPGLACLNWLGLASTRLRDASLRVLVASEHWPRLTVLLLNSNEIGNAGMVALASSPRLEGLRRLTLGYNQVGDEGLAALARLPLKRLRELELSNNRIGTAGVQALATSPSLTNLRVLALSYNEVGDGGAQALAASPHLTRLRQLWLYNTHIGDAGALAFAEGRLPWMESLNLRGNPITQRGGAALLARFGERVDLEDVLPRAPEEEPPALSMDERAAQESLLAAVLESPDDDGPRLAYADWVEAHGDPERAELIRLQVDLAHGSPIDPHARLAPDDPRRERYQRSRDLLRVHEERWGQEELPRWVSRPDFVRGFVEHISCTATQWLRRGEELSHLPLRSLHLRVAGPRLADVAACEYLARISELHLARTPLDADRLRALAASPHLTRLKRLDLGGSKLTVDATEALASGRWPALTSLGLAGVRLGDRGAQTLAAANLEWLTDLDLESNALGDRAAVALASAGRLTALTRLRLVHNRISGVGTAALLGAGLPALRRLDLAFNQIGTAGLDGLTGIAPWSGPVELLLPNNHMEAAGVRGLAAWPGLASLGVLDLAYNGIGDEGAIALAASPYAAGLTELDLSSNDIGDVGVTALAASPHLGNLRALSLSHNRITGSGLRALAESSRLRLTELSVFDNPGASDRNAVQALRAHFGQGVWHN